MPLVRTPSHPSGGSAADVFLHLQTKRAGKVKGEAVASGHADDIIVARWQWGISASAALGSAQATGRRSYTALTIHKNIDRASTALMAALATNDEVKEARLTMRRSGGDQEDYYTITLAGARISSLEQMVDAEGNTAEAVNIVFTKVDVEYRPQLGSGLRGGSTSFSDEILPT
jgi:type VI secretion system secreted protein Hcp